MMKEELVTKHMQGFIDELKPSVHVALTIAGEDDIRTIWEMQIRDRKSVV